MHKNLGGTGVVADYDTCYAQSAVAPSGICANYFGPTAPKVIGGYDFVGEGWPNTGRTEDPNPIALKGTGTHGTHVADIIAGKSANGTHKGMAPGAKLIAVKVCSAVSSSCNGVALLSGVDFALDPNGDHDLSDAADVINLSLGSDYGQIEDDLTQALTNAVNLGVVVVASAGNGADRPYKLGSPSIAPGVLSVAQTEVPSATVIPLVINSPAAIAGTYVNTATLDWAPIGSGAVGDVKTATQAGGTNNLACDALPAGSLAGKIALVDRGTCSISVKVDNAANAGAKGVLIALIAAGDAVSFSFGGGSNFVPSMVIQQSLGNAIKANLSAPVNVSLSPTASIALVGGMAGTSSRGPGMSTQGIKPEIGAPGASVSAEVGTGIGQIAFGGTSGAAPMVAGAAALMVQAHPARSALQIKAMLMNGAETNVYTSKAIYPGQLAPISRIGAGELRVNRSVVPGRCGLGHGRSVGIFGLRRTGGRPADDLAAHADRPELHRDGQAVQYHAELPLADDGRPTRSAYRRRQRRVAPNSSANIVVSLLINPTKLPSWTLNGGSKGGNGQC
ncbi:MAG: S8 family serine peptidase [Betaproteobacteria bacterium]|nr:S8 family serine peptidase [Betaproteobacteria bacterium]